MAAVMTARLEPLLQRSRFLQCLFVRYPLSFNQANYNFSTTSSRHQRSCNASITRLKKSTYPRMYKVSLVQSDGSSYTIRYHEPLKLVRLPVDPSTLTEEERKERLRRLKPEKPKKIYQIEDDDGDFDQRSWTNLIKKKS